MKYVPWTMFLDDQRRPFSDDTATILKDDDKANRSLRWAKDFDHAVAQIEFYELPTRMYLDGYLGPGKTGLQFLQWLKANHLEAMKKVEVFCHSSDWETLHTMREFVNETWPKGKT